MVDKVRLRNFMFLFKQFSEDRKRKWPDEPDRGMLKRFAEHLELNPIYLSNVKTGSKKIGVKTARQIEARMNQKPGWLDTDHSHTVPKMDEDEAAFVNSVVSAYRQCPEESRALMLRAFQALATGFLVSEALKGGYPPGEASSD